MLIFNILDLFHNFETQRYEKGLKALLHKLFFVTFASLYGY